MARPRRSRRSIPFPEWQRRPSYLIRLEDQGRSIRLDPATFGIHTRDRSWNLFARDLIYAENRDRVTCLFRTQLPAQTGRFSLAFSAFEAQDLSAI